MEQHGRSWRLLVALLVMGLSSGLNERLGAMASLASRDFRARVSQQAALPPRLAAALRRPVARSAPAGRPLGGTGPITWTQQGELTSTTEVPGDGYGQAVALSGDIAVIGAAYTPPSSADGAAYVFARSGGVWTQQAELTDPSGVPNDQFGSAVAVSGTTLAVGAPNVNGSVGAVYLYGWTGTAWTLQATVTPADPQFEDFGNALALSGDTLVVGADAQNGGNGAVYIFGHSGGVWRQQAEIRDPGGLTFAEFGWAVALSGETVVVGAPNAPVAYVYVRSGGGWSFQGVLQAPHAPSLYYGISVALSGDTALVGASESALGTAGAVYVFGRSGSVWTLLTTIPPPPGSNGNAFGEGVALSGATAVLGATVSGSTWARAAPGWNKPPSCPRIGQPTPSALPWRSWATRRWWGRRGYLRPGSSSCAAGWATRCPPTMLAWRSAPLHGATSISGCGWGQRAGAERAHHRTAHVGAAPGNL